MQKNSRQWSLVFFLAMSLLWCNDMFARGEVPRVSVKVENSSLKDLFKEIEKQTTYIFSYREGVLVNAPRVSVSLKNAPVNKVLDVALKNTGIEYRIVSSRSIVISDNRKSVNKKKEEESRSIHGRVVDAAGEPITGVTVMVKGTTIGTAADFDGNFSLENVPANAKVIFNMIGYTRKEIPVSNISGLARVVLEENSVLLDEMVVVGYGQQSEKLLTTSISSVKMDDIDQGNDYNVAKMLQGRTPGVSVATASGKPGQTPNVRVRGIASISGSATPLYVVDGVPNENLPYLNPNDIERMDVLKDASATAIYGSRANNGVVIITTKSGATDTKTRFNASVRHSLGWIAHDIEMANSSEYIRTIRQAVENYNYQFKGVKALESFMIPDNIQETNWMDWLQRDMANTTNANLSMQGGNSKTSFFTSMGYNSQQGIIKRTKFDQFNARAKFSHVINRIFKVNLNLSGSYTSEFLSEEGDGSLKIIRSAREQQPWIGPYDNEGNYTKNGSSLLRHNPVMVLNEESNTNNRVEGQGSLNIEITPFRGFKWIPSVSVYGKFSDGKKKLTELNDARGQSSGWGALTQQKNTTYRIVIDNVLQYDNSISHLMYSLMAGHSYEKYAYEQFGVKSDNYKDDAYPSSGFDLVNSGTAIYPNSIGYNAYAIESWFGRVALNWDNRYILNATIRSDGSSRFPKNHRYGTFPSASLAWRITNEHFFPKNSVLNDLKLRLSWGNTGSMAGISDWSAMSLISSSTGSSYNHSSGLSIGNSTGDLTWEKSTQYNIGVDAELFNNRLRLGLDLYHQTTNGLLYNTNLIATSGFTGRTANRGRIENKGIEFIVSGDIFTGDFNWNLSANISHTRNKLLELDGSLDMEIKSASGIEGGSYHALIVGKPVSAYYMYRQDGIYQKDSDVPAKLFAKGVRAGDVMYHDLNGDGDITADDRMYVGKVTPDITGGITSTMSWKGFDLSIFCQFAAGGKVLAAWRGCGSNEGTESLGYGGGQSFNMISNGETVSSKAYFNISKYVANHYWYGEGTSNTVPRPVLKNTFTGGFSNYLTSTRYLEDASYFKFKTITLGYTLPKHIVSKARISSVRFYVSLDNFFTFTSYSGYDPEFSYSSSPSAATYGADFGEQATLKSLIFGVNVNF